MKKVKGIVSKIKWLALRKGLFTEFRAYNNKWIGKTIIGRGVLIGKKSVIDRYIG